MREKPFYEATSLLEKSIHMNKIMDMIGKLQSGSNFASKQEDKNFKIAMANRDKLRMTQPYDGMVGLRAESDGEEDEYRNKVVGRAAFKVKQGENMKTETSAEGQPQQQQTNGMLQSEELKEICEKHALTRGEVYQIRSEFMSMCDLAKQDFEYQKNQKDGTVFDQYKPQKQPLSQREEKKVFG